MARTDLLLQLVQSGAKGDRQMFKKVVEAIIAEERAKQHNTLADKLQDNIGVLDASLNTNITYLNGQRIDSKSNNYVYEQVPNIRINDLVLDETLKEICFNLVQEHNRADLLRSYNLEPRHRILFIGPPGNGKTSLAEAIANELMVPFFSVKYENIIASYLGETSTRLKAMFDYIRTQQCVLFFDEFDSISKERGDKHETGEIKRLVSSLLLQIDRLPSYVVVIAATNHPELLDKAVWRRFQVKLNLEKPNQQAIQKFIVDFETKFNVTLGYQASYVARQLNDMSFSEINDVCLDILRKYILTSVGDSSRIMKEITKETLARLKNTN